MREVVRGIFTWARLSEPHGYDFNGHLVRDPGGNVCVDPVPPDDDTLAALVREGVATTALTNRNHLRAANLPRERTGARTLLHAADAAYAREQGGVVDGDV